MIAVYTGGMSMYTYGSAAYSVSQLFSLSQKVECTARQIFSRVTHTLASLSWALLWAQTVGGYARIIEGVCMGAFTLFYSTEPGRFTSPSWVHRGSQIVLLAGSLLGLARLIRPIPPFLTLGLLGVGGTVRVLNDLYEIGREQQ